MRKRNYQRIYMFAVGAATLVALYLGVREIIYGLIALLAVEAITNYRLVTIAGRIFGVTDPKPAVEQRKYRFNIDAERVWQISVACVLLISYVAYPSQLWFFPWFLGFAVLGAGVSGVCPLIWSIRAMGFK